MASTSKCRYCGATILSSDQKCPNCGAANDQYVQETERTVFFPKTIDELREYCAERGMPLLRMRFFIGENYTEPKAFGIYKEGDRFIVYKNKANGNRSIRYHGPDETYAVKELFMKLLDECHIRGIYPDGKPPEEATENNSGGTKKKLKDNTKVILTCLVTLVLVTIVVIILTSIKHGKDGYYNVKGTDLHLYRYADNWYCNYGSDWEKTDTFGIEIDETNLEFAGKNYDTDWNEPDFKQSREWETIRESHSSGSSDYDSWDSGDTDWDSDW